MDLATLIGLIGVFGIVIASMILGGSASVFVKYTVAIDCDRRLIDGGADEVQFGSIPWGGKGRGQGFHVQAG